MTRKIIFSLFIAILAFSCSEDESTNEQLTGKWGEKSPMLDRSEIVFESNDVMKVTLQNPERILSYTLLTFQGDSIELSDNLADMNNNVMLYFKILDEETVILENLYENENTLITFKRE